MQLPVICLRIMGYLSLITALAVFALALFGQLPDTRAIEGYLFACGLMGLVSGALIVAARLKEKDDPLAEKVVPSSLVAYLLFTVMTLHWLNN